MYAYDRMLCIDILLYCIQNCVTTIQKNDDAAASVWRELDL